jgi:hypothetical protein
MLCERKHDKFVVSDLVDHTFMRLHESQDAPIKNQYLLVALGLWLTDDAVVLSIP